jgi:hypothetical protein
MCHWNATSQKQHRCTKILHKRLIRFHSPFSSVSSPEKNSNDPKRIAAFGAAKYSMDESPRYRPKKPVNQPEVSITLPLHYKGTSLTQ